MGGPGSGDPNGNPANLTGRGRQWRKGESGNPSGRPSRMFTLVTMALREQLAAIDPKTKQTFAVRIAKLLINCAIDPDPELDKTRIMALSEIIDRCEGKAKQQLEVNDITSELRQRSDEDLMFYMEHHYWPEDEFREKRNKKILEGVARLEAAKTDPNTTQ